MQIPKPGKGILSKAGRSWRVAGYLSVITFLLLLTACSELRVIGGAAMKELKADGVNLEQQRYLLSKN